MSRPGRDNSRCSANDSYVPLIFCNIQGGSNYDPPHPDLEGYRFRAVKEEQIEEEIPEEPPRLAVLEEATQKGIESAVEEDIESTSIEEEITNKRRGRRKDPLTDIVCEHALPYAQFLKPENPERFRYYRMIAYEIKAKHPRLVTPDFPRKVQELWRRKVFNTITKVKLRRHIDEQDRRVLQAVDYKFPESSRTSVCSELSECSSLRSSVSVSNSDHSSQMPQNRPSTSHHKKPFALISKRQSERQQKPSGRAARSTTARAETQVSQRNTDSENNSDTTSENEDSEETLSPNTPSTSHSDVANNQSQQNSPAASNEEVGDDAQTNCFPLPKWFKLMEYCEQNNRIFHVEKDEVVFVDKVDPKYVFRVPIERIEF
ncbi:unnamed protein product [Bursaphelenchus xylophilus]|uniref:(pine wood nematode) hypothetical protein n=1 Tax=Bursaphelenchus xylophilus TaxID=6326 RepID=A0A1I7SFN2_BURXY|nr:unnamed protein product [Bursaphelenchus xylophilus]CAG9113439.1 unnamed protein product [Bursaphelenchus xylophilus]